MRTPFFTSILSGMLICAILCPLVTASALTITDGMNASGVIGQYGSDNSTPRYDSDQVNGGVKALGLSGPTGIFIDDVDHRLFVADLGNNRVIIHQLDANNALIDHVPDYVLGQPDFEARDATAAVTQSSLIAPRGIAYASSTKQLFVSQAQRISVFDLSSGITNGMNASYVLGQAGFTTNTAANSQSGFNGIGGILYVDSREQLFVAESNGHRVKVFDLSGGITNGMNASYVLGQSSFTTAAGAVTQAGMWIPRDVEYDEANQLLFVVQDVAARRVTVFDLSGGITNGMNASYVLGQANFTSNNGNVASHTAAGMARPWGTSYDPVNKRLFVSEFLEGNKIRVYDLSGGITNGMNASYVLGQPTFASTTASSSQSGLVGPYEVFHDRVSNRLWVADEGNSRVVWYDLAGGIADGMDASGVLGQYVDGTSTPTYGKGGDNNGPNRYGFNTPRAMLIDPVEHRLFVADAANNRVVVYALNSNNELGDTTMDYVLGQSDFNAQDSALTQSGLVSPHGLTLDPVNKLLFVSQTHRISVFDLSGGITNGMNASYVLGQADFVTNVAANTQSGLNNPGNMSYDESNKRLFVTEMSGHRVKVFDLSGGITNGVNASYVLGQAGFTTATAAVTQAGMREPRDVLYDSINQRLFVAQHTSVNRVTVYDLSGGITNGMNASYVLGQADFVTAQALPSRMGRPAGMRYDSDSSTLFVVDTFYNRVQVFDFSGGITNGMPPSNVLGQPDFTTLTAGSGQAQLNGPYMLEYEQTGKKLYVGDSVNNRIMLFDVSSVTPNAPVISSVSALPASDSAVITWTTDTAATSQVEYGTSSAYTASSTLTSATTTSHSVALTGLSPSTAYHFRVLSTDAYSQLSTSTDLTFTTTAASSGGSGSSTPAPSITPGAPTAISVPQLSAQDVSAIFGTSQADAGCRVSYAFSITTGKPCSSASGLSEGGGMGQASYSFGRDLSYGVSGPDVLELQKLLNSKGFAVAPAGRAGSAGLETSYFGSATRSALARFQAASGISPAAGYFGPLTRAFVLGK
ncbi:MAG TPA: fibronectin type III domain-containing protein [Candidatus Paceibacterota bacterium]